MKSTVYGRYSRQPSVANKHTEPGLPRPEQAIRSIMMETESIEVPRNDCSTHPSIEHQIQEQNDLLSTLGEAIDLMMVAIEAVSVDMDKAVDLKVDCFVGNVDGMPPMWRSLHENNERLTLFIKNLQDSRSRLRITG